MRFTAHTVNVFVFVACNVFLIGCASMRPSDVALDRIYLTDRQLLPNYHDSIEKKLVDPVGLAVELSSAEPFVGGALAADNFCGEALGVAKLGDGNLYSIGDIFSDPKLSKDRYLYLILVDLKERPALDRSYWPKFDLRTDARKICVQTVYRGRFFAGHSNIVRVQRSLIEKALKEGVKPLPIKLSRGL